MNVAGGVSGAVRDILLYRERLDQARGNIAAMAADIAALARDHAGLSNRVARIEGFIDGRASAVPPRRLPGPR